jgi:hypothetical protein
MEAAFRTDFTHVRVHDDAAAASSARDVGARAYTVGPDIVFGSGMYRPHDPGGRRLLAHELAHVVQQRDTTRGSQIEIGAPGTAAESEADAASRQVATGRPVSLAATVRSDLVQREVESSVSPGGSGLYPGPPVLNGRVLRDRALSDELSDSPAGATSGERVFAWLQLHAAEIGAAEARFGVDRRAIAGAIAWEALQNPRSSLEAWIGRFVGVGKPHVRERYFPPAAVATGETVAEEVERARLLPGRSVSERKEILATDAIPYVAAGMRLGADIAEAYGIHIAQNPAMLTWFWVSQDAVKFTRHLSEKSDSKLDPTVEAMPAWVESNLSWLSRAVGDSQLRPARNPLGSPTGDVEHTALSSLASPSWSADFRMDSRLPATRDFLVNDGAVSLEITTAARTHAADWYLMSVLLHRHMGRGEDAVIGPPREVTIGATETLRWTDLADGIYFFEMFSNGAPVEGNLWVASPRQAPLPESVTVDRFETASWTGSFQIQRRLPATREFSVNGGSLSVTVKTDTEYIRAVGYDLCVILRRRSADGGDVLVREEAVIPIGSTETLTWRNLVDGVYYFELISDAPAEGELVVTWPRKLLGPAGGAGVPATASHGPSLPAPVPEARVGGDAPAVLQRAPEDVPLYEPGDAGPGAPAMSGPTPDALERAAAAKNLVTALKAKAPQDPVQRGSRLNAAETERVPGWWWVDNKFDCSKFVLWVLAGRRVGDAPPSSDLAKAIREATAPPFGTEASSVRSMLRIVNAIVTSGLAGPIDKERLPVVGDLMFWGGHIAIVVEVVPTKDGTGSPWVVYAHMGRRPSLGGVDAAGNYWLKACEVADRPELGIGGFLGYWSPP